ncbi:MAG: SirB2 family protein [Gammaproteobacteria bacterium]
MIKIVHISLAVISFTGFISRAVLSEIRPRILACKAVKIAPHVIDTLLLISGILMIIQGHWLNGQHDWIIAKLAGLFAYIGFGAIALRRRGVIKWLAFAGAVACYAYIGSVAVTKQPRIF